MTQSTQKRLLFLEREAAPVKGLIRRVNELESRVLALEAMLEEIGAALAAHDAVLEFSDEEANDNTPPPEGVRSEKLAGNPPMNECSWQRDQLQGGMTDAQLFVLVILPLGIAIGAVVFAVVYSWLYL